ncbi:hypothetical protein EJB05_26648, partial [Eragrostis curvula]
MRPSASARGARLRRRAVPLTTVVVVSMALLTSLCLPTAADARTWRYHRKHRRHHWHWQWRHQGAANNGHVALPPDVDVDAPAEPPDDEDAPLPPSPGGRDDCKPCPKSRPPSNAPAPAPAPAKPPAFSSPKPPSPAPAKPHSFSFSHPPSKPPSPAPAKAPPYSRAKSPSHAPALPPVVPHVRARSLSPAKPPPAFSLAKPPSLPPASTPARSPRKAPAPPSFSPSKPPSSLPPSHASPPPCHSSAKPPQVQPPRLAPAKPPMPSPARAPRLAPASPPVAHPTEKPPNTSPAQPPQLSPAKPQPPVSSTAKPPQLAPATPPTQPPRRLTPVNRPALPPVSATPPAALPPSTPTPKATPPPPPPAAAAPVATNGSSACGGGVFDVRAFGASGNNSSNDTRAFRAAWKAACASDSATLLVPADGVFTITSTIFAGPCKPGLTFQIDGVLMPPDGPASWPATESRRQWVVFHKADGMTLAGRGTVEGNGEEWWDLPCKPHRGPNGSTLPGPCDSPALIRFFATNDVTVRGLRIENSPQFHLKFDACQRVRVDGLLVSSPAFSPNTDGIHVENTTSVQIVNSRIYNGDDCVSIGAGCSGIHIENVTCGHGHGISIGSLGVRNTRACVSNVTVRNARILDSDNGVRIKTWQGGAGAVSAVEFAGVQMQNVKNCIVIDQYYCLGSGCANQTSAVRVAGVAYRDIRGTYNPRGGGAPIRLACSDAVACTDITMSGVELVPAGGGVSGEARLPDPFCWNAYGLMETQTLPPLNCLQEGRPESLQDQLTSC